jgi:flagellin-like protein
MKANRKFLNNDDEAVSPVIAVILMVAITVVLAATVYVWVSGFGSNSSQPAKSMALTSGGALASGVKEYVVASASPGLKWGDLTFTLNGAPQDIDSTDANCAAGGDPGADEYTPCTDTSSAEATSDLVSAGDGIHFHTAAGQTLRVLDSASNSIILTLTVS